MDAFGTSASLIIALGKTILHSLWIGFLILALLRMLLLAIPERHSNRRYLLSVASMALLAGAVFTTFFLLYAPGNQAASGLNIWESHRIIPQFLAMDYSASSKWDAILLFPLCSYLYFAGMIFMLLRSVFSIRYIRSLRNSGQQVHDDWLDRMKRISNSMGIHREVSFLQSSLVKGPILIGVLKPAVIVPLGMFTHLSVSQVESILVHELYHLKRLDYLVNIMQLFMEGLLFYNPAVWFISDRIRREREHSCDDAVVRTSNDPLNYAKALVRLAEKKHYIHLAPGAGGSNKDHFMTRIRRIINESNMKKNTQERVMSLLLFVGAIMVALVISGFSSGFSIIKQSDSHPERWAQSVAPLPQAISIPVQDTIRDPKKQEELKEMKELDWDQIKEDMESARIEAMEEIDWDQIKEDMESARIEAMEEIDWDQIKEDMEAAKIDAIADMDLDMDFDFDIDLESIRENMDEARREMKEIDWEEIKRDMEHSLSEMQFDMEEMKREIEESIQEIDWDDIRIDIENSWPEADSLHIEKER